MGEAGEVSTTSRRDFCFKSDIEVSISPVDIVTFAFARLRRHDPEQVIYAETETPSHRILARDVRSQVARLSAWLKTRGLEAGDCICIHSYNSIWYPLLWLATLAAGGIVTGSNPAYTSSELVHHLQNTKAKFVVAQKSCLAAVKEAVSDHGIPMCNLFILGADDIVIGDNPTSQYHLHQERNDNEAVFNFASEQSTNVAVYAATSGTTGLPKAAALSHKYLVAQTSLLEHLFSNRSHEIRQLVCLPVFHAFAAQLSIVLPLRLGITTYFMPRFNLSEYLHNVDHFQITDSAVVPPIIGMLLEAPPSRLSSIQYMICAGAPMTAAVQTKLYSNLHASATIAQCWGTTELGWHTVFSQSERDYTGSVGRLLPNVILKIVDDQGNIVTIDNVPGEALVKSSSMFTGYRTATESTTADLDVEGFYRTGDRVYMCNGKVYICGRIKDTLKVNGWQVSPEELEQVVLEIDNVIDCAVIGHTVIGPSGLEETKPRAYVVKKLGAIVTKEMVQKHVNDKLVRYKRLSGGVVFVEKIPRSNTGKILRRVLSAMDVQDDNRDIQLHGDSPHGSPLEAGRYLLAAVLVPLCFALGLPGLVLLAIVMKQLKVGK